MTHPTSGPLELTRNRAVEQRRDHWVEFAIIMASANAFAALVLAGRLVERATWDTVSWACLAAGLASIPTVILGYTSVQLGSLLDSGPLDPIDVALSFLIATAQLALFALPAHVLDPSLRREPDQLLDLLHWWPVGYCAFAFAGLAANARGARNRETSGLATRKGEQKVAGALDGFHKRQEEDRWKAGLTGLFVGAIAGCTLWTSSETAFFVSAGVVAIGSALGIASHWHAGQELWRELGISPLADHPRLR